MPTELHTMMTQVKHLLSPDSRSDTQEVIQSEQTRGMPFIQTQLIDPYQR